MTRVSRSKLRSLGVETPIVALFGDSLQLHEDLFLKAGADDYEATVMDAAPALASTGEGCGTDAAVLLSGDD
ncbi:hypothetical protein MUK42_33791 [Musa troglodytarum]|uniref:Uncharacterized protein n=1 Tax=Musa troglodytarum TaxID=320322 RepID=A0A9E7GIJ1_9LILI|nr:hypothetical protein MUK42_33791 [Musa troglodytarum]